MYKLLLFLNKTDDEQIIDHFQNVTLKLLEKVADKEIKTANIESNLLLDQKYSKFCEVSAASKEEWDVKMNSKAGKELNKDLINFHKFITTIFVNYEN